MVEVSKLTEKELELKRWVEAEPTSKFILDFPLGLEIVDNPELLIVFLDSPVPEKLFIITRIVVSDCDLRIIKGLCVRMVNKFIKYRMGNERSG